MTDDIPETAAIDLFKKLKKDQAKPFGGMAGLGLILKIEDEPKAEDWRKGLKR